MTYLGGFNFRQTAAFVTDGPGDAPALGELYPHAYTNGLTAGWTTALSDGTRDRLASNDPRLAGTNSQANDGTQKSFRITLPSAGTKLISLAIGDAGFPQNYQHVEVWDNTTLLYTIDKPGTLENNFLDATGTQYTAALWASAQALVPLTFATTTMFVVIGSPTVQVNTTTIAHLGLWVPVAPEDDGAPAHLIRPPSSPDPIVSVWL